MDLPPAMSSPALTVQAVLGLPSVRRGAPRVVAGRDQLRRPIRWVHTGEAKHVATLLKGDELLLITGMGIGRAAADQRTFIRGLVERGVAGLIIELGAVFSSLPTALIKEAEACELPLVELRREIPFVEVTEEVHSVIVNRQLAVLRRGDDLHRSFNDLILQGASIPEILAVLARTIGNPVVLHKANRGVAYHAVYRTPSEEVLTRYELLEPDLQGGADAAESIARPVPAADHRSWGFVAALAVDSPIDDFDRVAVEQAVAVIALALLRNHEEATLLSRQRGNFLADVAASRVGAADAAARALALDFDHARGQLVALAIAPALSGDDPSPYLDEKDGGWAEVWACLRRELARTAMPAIVGTRVAEGDTLVVLGIRQAGQRVTAIEQAVALVETAVSRCLGGAGRAVVVAGPALPGWAALPASLRQVAEILTTARRMPGRRWHDATTPDLDRALWHLRDDHRIREFADHVLAPVLDHDLRHVHKLMPTLEALAANGWQQSKTARALHLNRRSLYPRIERLQRLLGCDLSDLDARLAIELALRMRVRRVSRVPERPVAQLSR
jgi:purine catabolism regulator